MISFDIGNVLVNLWSVWHRDKEFQDWLRLILSCIFSGAIAMMGTWGATLVSGSKPWVAFGYGLCAAATAVLTVLLRMRQGRSLMVAAPTQVIKQYEAAGQTIIEPVEGKK